MVIRPCRKSSFGVNIQLKHLNPESRRFPGNSVQVIYSLVFWIPTMLFVSFLIRC